MTSIDSDIIQQQGITFRAGVPSDLEAITRVFLAGLDTMLPNRRWGEERYVWERDMAEGGSLRLRSEKMLRDELVRLAVTVRGGEETVLAFVSFVLASKREDRRGKITNLFVHPDAHGLHIGPTLISWVQERVRADALSSRQEGEQATAAVWLKVCARNAKGIRIYNRAGFIHPGPGPEYNFSHPEAKEDMIILEWSSPVHE